MADICRMRVLLCIVVCVAWSRRGAAGSPKKGFGLSMKVYRCNDTQALTGTSWWYNWGPSDNQSQHMGCSLPPRGEFVPMQWGYYGHKIILPSSAQHVLGFNEPNHRDQSNMTPNTAASSWRYLELAAKGMTLISPAPARCRPHGSGGKCTMETFHWLDKFFQACRGCRVDAVAVHSYYCDANNTMAFLEQVHRRYHKKVWLTEFACPHHPTVARVEHFMKQIIPRLERAPFVERYAWFSARIRKEGAFVGKVNSLLNDNSSTLTSLGKLYVSLRA